MNTPVKLPGIGDSYVDITNQVTVTADSHVTTTVQYSFLIGNALISRVEFSGVRSGWTGGRINIPYETIAAATFFPTVGSQADNGKFQSVIHHPTSAEASSSHSEYYAFVSTADFSNVITLTFISWIE